MKKDKNNKNLAQRLSNANILSDGALYNIPYEDLIIAKIESESKNTNKQ